MSPLWRLFSFKQVPMLLFVWFLYTVVIYAIAYYRGLSKGYAERAFDNQNKR